MKCIALLLKTMIWWFRKM